MTEPISNRDKPWFSDSERKVGRWLVELAAVVLAVGTAVVQGFAALLVTDDLDSAVAVVRTEGIAGFIGVVPRAIESTFAVLWGTPMLGVVGGVLAMAAWRNDLVSSDNWRDYGFGLALVATVAAMCSPLIRREPWWPIEQIGLLGRADLCVGYVIGSQADGQWLVVLPYDTERVIYLPSDAVKHRVPLEMSPAQRRELGMLLQSELDELDPKPSAVDSSAETENVNCPAGWATKNGLDEERHDLELLSRLNDYINTAQLPPEQMEQWEALKRQIDAFQPASRSTFELEQFLATTTTVASGATPQSETPATTTTG